MKVAFVTGLCVKHDAISNSVRDAIVTLTNDPAVEAFLYAYRCDFPELPHRCIESAADMALDPFFRDADLVVFHFGVFYPLFDAIFMLPRRQPVLCWFHNITPKAYVKPEFHAMIDRSLQQISNLAWAAHIVCDSDTNRVELQKSGIRTSTSVIPLAVPDLRPPPAAKPAHRDRMLRLAFIGRFVQSKGCDDLVNACMTAAHRRPGLRFHLDIIGNTLFADAGILDRLRVLANGIQPGAPVNLSIRLHESIDDDLKMHILRDADVFVLPTYHEGFCVPIVEAIASACRVISYANSNVPAIADGMATLVETGNVVELCDAVVAVTDELTSAAWASCGYARYRERCIAYADQFSLDRFAKALNAVVHRFACRPSSALVTW